MVAAEESIARVQSVFLNNLQESMVVVCPELSNNDSRALLGTIIAYEEAIDWELKNHQGKTIQAIRSKTHQGS